MSWIPFALLCHIFWAFSNVGDKYFIEKHFRSPFSYLFFGYLFGIISLAVIPFVKIEWVGWPLAFWIFVAAVAYFLMNIFYAKAVQLEEISRIGIVWNVLPLFSLTLAWFSIGEKLNAHQFLAFVLLCSGALVASLHARGGKILFSRGLVYMVVACLFDAFYVVIFRYITHHTSFANAFVYVACFLPLLSFTLLLLPRCRDEIKKTSQELTWFFVFLMLLVAVLGRSGVLFNNWAVSLGPVALVNAMEGTQTIFVFIITVLLTLFLPKFLKEEIDRRNILLKLSALIFVISGILILTLR